MTMGFKGWHERHAWARPWHQRFRRSLSKRLVLLFLLMAVCVTLVFMGGMRAALGSGFKQWFKPLITDYVDRVAADIGSPPDVEKARALTQRLPISVRIEGPVVNWDSHPDHHKPWKRGDDSSREHEGDKLFTRTTADGHRIQFGWGEAASGEPMVTGRVLWPLAGLLLVTWLTFAAVRRMFRPLDDIRAGAIRYGEGRFDEPIPIRRQDELGDLATQVNAMASGLQGMLQGQRALLLAISHELRSPLTRARLNTELLADGREREALLRDLSLMSELITDLLESERLTAGAVALKRESCDLNTLVQEVLATQFAGQRFELDLAADLPPLALDRSRVTLLLRNLVDNACRHGAGAERPVQLSTRVEPHGVRLVVRDHGPGVAEEHLARLTEPFYRPDTARTRSAGGVGLGLYLCKLVAQSHGGTLVLRNATPGLAVEVHWPG